MSFRGMPRMPTTAVLLLAAAPAIATGQPANGDNLQAAWRVESWGYFCYPVEGMQRCSRPRTLEGEAVLHTLIFCSPSDADPCRELYELGPGKTRKQIAWAEAFSAKLGTGSWSDSAADERAFAFEGGTLTLLLGERAELRVRATTPTVLLDTPADYPAVCDGLNVFRHLDPSLDLLFRAKGLRTQQMVAAAAQGVVAVVTDEPDIRVKDGQGRTVGTTHLAGGIEEQRLLAALGRASDSAAAVGDIQEAIQASREFGCWKALLGLTTDEVAFEALVERYEDWDKVRRRFMVFASESDRVRLKQLE